MARNDFANSIQCDDASEGAAYGLLALMTGISEECWCAGWMDGLEYRLWDIAISATTPTRYGQGEISPRVTFLLKNLALEAGGWWIYDDTDGVKFLRTEDWISLRKQKGLEP